MRPWTAAPLALILVSIGLFHAAPAAAVDPSPGYTLYGQNGGTHSYLLDLSNAVVKTWTHAKVGGYSVYLLEDGTLLRPAESNNSILNGGAAAGIIQKIASDGTVLWDYLYSSNTYRAHHDIEPLPNGNVLLIAWEVKSAAEAVQAGLNRSVAIWPDHIVEVRPTGSTTGAIVWQWHAWDHLIQDYNPAKSNYGVVADHPELLDINLYTGGGMGGGDWMHINAISYDADRDQIVISSHNLDEIYVIDHSTTTAEAASHTGGRSGKGGDILYRWGKPANYKTAGAQYFNVVHCSTWIPDDCPGAGHILAFNNREGTNSSQVVELAPPDDGAYGYLRTGGAAFGPTAPLWDYSAAGFYANHLGSAQRLPNGNTLIAESTSAYLFEVDSLKNVVWSYAPGGGEIARCLRYPYGYAGLVALGFLTGVGDSASPGVALAQNLPNPVRAGEGTTIEFTSARRQHVELRVYDLQGRLVATLVDEEMDPGAHRLVFDAQGLASGMYFYRLRAGSTQAARRMLVVK